MRFRPPFRVASLLVASTAAVAAALSVAGCSSAPSNGPEKVGVSEQLVCSFVNSSGGDGCGGSSSGAKGGSSSGGVACGELGGPCCVENTCYYGLSCTAGTCQEPCGTAGQPTCPEPPPCTYGVPVNGQCVTEELSAGVAFVDPSGGSDPNAHDYEGCQFTSGDVSVPAALATMGCTLGLTYEFPKPPAGQTSLWAPTAFWACTNFTAATGYTAIPASQPLGSPNGYESACIGPTHAGFVLVGAFDGDEVIADAGPCQTILECTRADSMPAGGPCVPPYP
jgi:hypothetical protein